ncbi:MAG: M67 family metallopeptidase [Planctomycetes bacterium]|nr:M67 family metallopeptidase [Planctomycetota bacterium]
MLELPAGALDELRAFARAAYPKEACGLLVGERRCDARTVRRVLAAENRRAGERADRFDIDPLFYKRTEDASAAEGLAVVGIYHSHPDHPARPSATDAEFGRWWPGYSFVILSVAKGEVRDVRSWHFPEGAEDFEEEAITNSA